MGLVDYSESDSSDDETQTQQLQAPPPQKPSTSASSSAPPPKKQPFQKVVRRSSTGKLVVSLPSATSADSDKTDEPPAKRARTAGSGGGLFSGFNSLLPPPKRAAAGGSSDRAPKAKPGVSLRTSAAPGFSRDADGDGGDGGDEAPRPSGGMSLPPPKKQAEPSIPEEQKAAEDVKLVGKPLMFKPLSVSRNPNKKKTKPEVPKPTPATTASERSNGTGTATSNSQTPAAPLPPPKKVSLFSMHAEEATSKPPEDETGAYEPMFSTLEPDENDAAGDNPYLEYDRLQAQQGHNVPAAAAATAATTDSLGDLANDMNLSAAERRELFGRHGAGAQRAARVVNFNMDTEYRHNEELRAAGQEQIHNPVRAIQGGGKHSLRQLVNNAQMQKDALEESFAKGKSNRKEASSRYGW